MKPESYDADVIVVGCGPVGVMAALRCAQLGLKVIAIDRSTEVYPLPRSLGMDDETQALFARAGLIDELRAHSLPIPGGEFVNAAGERVVGIELPEGTVSALGFPPIVTFDQPAVETFLRAAAIAAGVDMRLGLEAFAIGDLQGGDIGEAIQIDVSDNAHESSLTARWLIAADGAKSTIRSLCGISMIDQGFDQTWLVVDTTLLDRDLPLPRLARQYCDPARVCTFVPGPESHRRWEFQLRPEETREAVLDNDVIAELLAPWGTTDQLKINRAAVYRFHANVAETFRDGPVFLAGDAAHQMPPFNGQGMCSGMRDAENLSWKLATVAAGRAGSELLDTYDEERRSHATEQVAHSVDAGLLMQAIANDGKAALESGYGRRPFPKLTGAMFVGAHDSVGIVQPKPLTDTAPLGKGWRLLRFGAVDPIPELWGELGATVSDVANEAFPGLAVAGATVIVRPDRYIASVTTDLVQVTRQIAATLQRSAPQNPSAT